MSKDNIIEISQDNPLYIDNREKNELLVNKVLASEFRTELTRLAVGDYMWLNDYCVEVKEINDFFNSLDGRMWSQLDDMTTNYGHNFLVIHGRIGDLWGHRDKLWHQDSMIIGAIARISLNYNVNVIKVDSVDMAANLIRALYKKTFIKGSNKHKIATRTFPDYRLAVLHGLPLVSSDTAKALLDRFGTIRNIAIASEKELMEVKGIGKGKASKIYTVLNSEEEITKQISKGY